MTAALKAPFIISILLGITACGGGGGGSDSGTGGSGGGSGGGSTPPSASQIIANAPQYTPSELKSAAKSLADDAYNGSTGDAEIDIAFAQRVMNSIFSDGRTTAPDLFAISFDDIPKGSNITYTASCLEGGTATYSGSFSADFVGTLSVSFNNCFLYNPTDKINGTAAVNIESATGTRFDASFYYSNLRVSYGTQTVSFSGVSEILTTLNENTNTYTQIEDNYTLVKIGNQSPIFLQAVGEIVQNENFNFSVTGSVFFEDKGKVDISTSNLDSQPPWASNGEVVLSANKNVKFEFIWPHIKYIEDTNNDDEYDVGTYFANAEMLLDGPTSNMQLVALNNLSLPPSVNPPNVNYYTDYFTTTPIPVNAGYYSDPDTNDEELSVSYAWYLNDVLLAEQSSDILPSGIAVFGDKLEVSMLVSDGVNVTESSKVSITILDSPYSITVSNTPSNISAGDTVEFSVLVVDPDNQQSSDSGGMIAAPSNASIDDNGLVTWQVPSSLRFPVQTYEFTFSTGESNSGDEEFVNVELEVKDAQASMPLARSGIEVPKVNNSIHVGDFDGDGLNEVLSTDTRHSVFLLEFVNDEYIQKWVYPFKIGASDNLVQVLAVNTDEDAAQEILVVDQHGIYLINGMNTLATELYSTERKISYAEVAYIDDDGSAVIALISHPESSYSTENAMLHVFSVNTPENELFTTSLGDASSLDFGNVDTDSNVELIINNGRVYDTSTWANQWLSGNTFGKFIAVADYNNDGIDEIAGTGPWGKITVYSAETRSQLANLDNVDMCSIQAANVDTDASYEILAGRCQSGRLVALSLENSQLAQNWEFSDNYSRVVSIALGDSDNDGLPEAHWSSGTGSSGTDRFVAIDINPNDTNISNKNDNSQPQLDDYSSAGWSKLTDGDERAVFFVPRTGSGYDGSVFSTITETGLTEISDVISTNWNNDSHAVTSDYNNDGFGDIFVPNASYYSGSFAAIQISNGAVQWQTPDDGSSNIGVMKAFDVNKDGFEDAIYIDGNTLQILDVMNQSILGNIQFESSLHDFTMLNVDGTVTAVVTYGEKVAVYTYSGNGFSEQSFIQQRCERIESINYDTDAALELACLNHIYTAYYDNPQSMFILEMNDFVLTEQASNPISKRVSDFVVDPSTSNEQNIFMVSLQDIPTPWYSTNSGSISKATSLGHVIWTGPELIGEARSHGLKIRLNSAQNLEFLLSSSQMMYWIK